MTWCVLPQDVLISNKGMCSWGQRCEMFLGQRDFFPWLEGSVAFLHIHNSSLNVISAGLNTINKAATNTPGTHTIDFQKEETTNQLLNSNLCLWRPM